MTDYENKHWAFLSGCPEDNREQRPDSPTTSHLCWGNWLHEALKNFPVPTEFIGQPNGRDEIIPERIEPIFQDESELAACVELRSEIRQALEKSICLVVICSPRSAQSLQVNEVVRYFKQLGRGQNILPIVIAGEPYASEGNQSGRLSTDECFVPALRHPVLPDGSLDFSRRAGRHIFVDARHGTEKREILANDHRHAEADLEMAKVQLIALVIGVGFNGLWQREQKRHFFDFAEAQQQVREAERKVREAQDKNLEIQNLPPDVHSQIQEAQQQVLIAQNQAREAQNQLEELRRQAEEVRNRFLAAESQLTEAREQVRAAQNQILEVQQPTPDQLSEAQNLPPDIHEQIQTANDHVLAAQNEARIAQEQVRELQAKVQATETELAEAHERAIADEEKVRAAEDRARETQDQILEMQQSSPDADSQLSAAQNETRVAQEQLWELQDQLQAAQIQLKEAQQNALADENKISAAENLAQTVQSQLEAAQNQVRELQNAQSQFEQNRQQAEADVENKLSGAQNQVREFQDQVQSAQKQLEESRQQLQLAQRQVLESQNQARTAQAQVGEFQNKVQDTQAQLEAARTQALADEKIILDAQQQEQLTQSELNKTRNLVEAANNQYLAAQTQVQEFQNQVRATENQLTEVRLQAHEAQDKILEMESRARETHNEFKAAQNQIQKIQDKNRKARRLTQVFAVLAVLGLLSASITLRQRKIADQTLAKKNSAAVGQFDPGITDFNAEQIRQALQNLGGVEQARSLDELAAWIPRSEIPEALKSSAGLLNDQQRSHFQKWLLIRLSWVNPLVAMTNASAIDGKIVNDAGASDSNIYFQLAVLESWMKMDLSGAFDWVCQLPDGDARQRALEKIIPSLVANNPVQAIQQAQQLHNENDTILDAIVKTWVDQQPDAAVGWIKSQPTSESKTKLLTICIDELAKTDVPRALALAESLPENFSRSVVIADLFNNWAAKNPSAATQFANQHPELSAAALGGISDVWFPDNWAASKNWIESLTLPPETMQLQPAPSSWTKFLLDSNFDGPTNFPVETKNLSTGTNDPVQIKPTE